jgi:transposase
VRAPGRPYPLARTLLVSTGKSGNEAARLVGRTSGWVSVLVRSYNENGAEGVETVKRQGQQWGGHEACLRWGTEEETELREALRHATPEGEVWTAAKVAAWLSERRGRKASRSHGLADSATPASVDAAAAPGAS